MRRCEKDVRAYLKGRGHHPAMVDEYVDEAMHGDGVSVWRHAFTDVPRAEYAKAVETDYLLYVNTAAEMAAERRDRAQKED